jgi:hypothetical protein
MLSILESHLLFIYRLVLGNGDSILYLEDVLMNKFQLIEAVKILLIKEQEILLKEANKASTTKARELEINSEVEEIEVFVEYTRAGWEEI